MSRHARRGTQGEQEWEPGQYPRGDGGGPLGPGQPDPEPMAPERWERQSWDSGGYPAAPPAGQPWDEQSWDGEQPWDQQAAWDEQQSWGALPGAEHPSGPLSPLPHSDYDWRDPGRDPLAPLPPRLSSRHAAPSREPDAPGYPPGYPSGSQHYQAGPAGYPSGPYPAHPADYAGEPAGYGDEPAAYPAEHGYPGYEGYVDQPGDADAVSIPGSGAYPAAGEWYGGEDEPPHWADDEYGRDLLPGLDPGQGAGPASQSGGSGRKRRRRSRTVALVLLSVFVIFAAVVGGVGYHYYRMYFNPPDFSGPGTGTVVVQILPGDAALTVGDRLAALGVVASGRAFENAAKANPHGNALEPGYYRVHKQMKASLALALLLNQASRVQSKVTIPEGFRLDQIIARLGQDTGNLKGYEQAIANPAALGLPAFANGKPEGYLFPATYEVQPKTPPAAVLKSMVQQFNLEAASIGLPAAAAAAHESQGAVITVASLIEAEGKLPADYPKIAEVIYNRLNANPPIHLQLDTTVLYGMDLVHSKAPFSTTFPSPYNTYAHAGLPPGPIDSPGKLAIEAALHPAHGNLLYFLTINSLSGKTLFFSNATQFDAAVAQYGSTGGSTGGRG